MYEQKNLLLPLAGLVVVVGGETLDRVHPQSDHPLDLGLLLLLVGDGVGRLLGDDVGDLVVGLRVGMGVVGLLVGDNDG